MKLNSRQIDAIVDSGHIWIEKYKSEVKKNLFVFNILTWLRFFKYYFSPGINLKSIPLININYFSYS